MTNRVETLAFRLGLIVGLVLSFIWSAKRENLVESVSREQPAASRLVSVSSPRE